MSGAMRHALQSFAGSGVFYLMAGLHQAGFFDAERGNVARVYVGRKTGEAAQCAFRCCKCIH